MHAKLIDSRTVKQQTQSTAWDRLSESVEINRAANKKVIPTVIPETKKPHYAAFSLPQPIDLIGRGERI